MAREGLVLSSGPSPTIGQASSSRGAALVSKVYSAYAKRLSEGSAKPNQHDMMWDRCEAQWAWPSVLCTILISYFSDTHLPAARGPTATKSWIDLRCQWLTRTQDVGAIPEGLVRRATGASCPASSHVLTFGVSGFPSGQSHGYTTHGHAQSFRLHKEIRSPQVETHLSGGRREMTYSQYWASEGCLVAGLSGATGSCTRGRWRPVARMQIVPLSLIERKEPRTVPQ